MFKVESETICLEEVLSIKGKKLLAGRVQDRQTGIEARSKQWLVL